MAAAARRWSRLMRARQDESQKLGEGDLGLAFASPAKAREFATQLLGRGAKDPVLSSVGREVSRRTSVLDVGSGPGRLTLPLAKRCGEVMAVDPDVRMLGVLRREARRLGLENVGLAVGRWEEVDVPVADLVVCCYVMHHVEDAVPFLGKVAAFARQRAFVCMGAMSPDAFLSLDPLWRHFHGRPRRPLPTYLDALDVLRELGIEASVELVTVTAGGFRFTSMAEAVASYRRLLLLPNTLDVRRELRQLLRPWLSPALDGLVSPTTVGPVAILSWRGRESSGGRFKN